MAGHRAGGSRLHESPRAAIETALPIAAPHETTPLVIDGLAEFDHEASTYIPVEELEAAAGSKW